MTWITFAVIPSDTDMSVQSRTLGRVACRTGSASCQRLAEALSGNFHFGKEKSFQSVETDHLNALKYVSLIRNRSEPAAIAAVCQV